MSQNHNSIYDPLIKEKQCKKCGIIKPLAEFVKNKRCKDGVEGTCLACYNKIAKSRPNYKENHTKAARKWEVVHKEQRRRIERNRYAKNIENARQVKYNWRIKNKDRHLANQRNWSLNNREKTAMYVENRRFAKMGGKVTPEDWVQLKDKYNNTCLCCRRTDVALEMDHVVPLKLGGHHHISNLQPLCRSCNSSKGAKEIDYR